jgi:CRISPR/Cas system endoribonuclease Cas6 (RAMP superfamily)
MRIVRAQLDGMDAEPGRVAAADVARIILGLERAIARAAYLVLERARRGVTGRHSLAIESAARLRFVGVDRGSFVGTGTSGADGP